MDDTAHTPLAIISHLYPQKSRPTYGIFVQEQTRTLVALGTPVIGLVVPVPKAPWPLPLLRKAWNEYANVEHKRTDFGSVEVFFPRYTSFPRKLWRTFSAHDAARSALRTPGLRERMGEAKVIVAHTALLDGRVASELSKRYNIPYVVFIHGEDLYQNVLGPQAHRLSGPVREVLSEASAVVAVSGPVADGLAQAFPDLPRPHVLPNGVDTQRFSPRPRNARRQAERAPLRLLSAAHLVPRKAHTFVLEAVATLLESGLDVEYTIAGNGPEAQRLEAKARELGIFERVAFTGAYQHHDLPALLHETDLFVLPSWDEAFGVVYLESLACGVPALAATDGGARTIIDDGKDGYLVEPKDADAIAVAIRRYAELDEAAQAVMHEHAREKSLAYTWEANARGLMTIIEDIS